MKISSKIVLASVLLSAIGIITAGSLVGWQASSIAAKAIENRAFSQLVAIREIQKTQIENYFDTIKQEITTYSNNRMIIDMATDFKQAFFNYSGQSTITDTEKLQQYYVKEFDQEYKKQNPASSISSIAKLEQLNENSKFIQHAYISANPNSLGNKNKLISANDDTQYSQLHKKYHPHLNQFLDAFGFYDIFLVEPETGYIIYSVFKELDFATSLISGPYKNTGLAEAFHDANNSSEKHSSFLIDFKPYFPSYDASAAFMSSAIYSDEGEKIGVLIFQMPISKINKLMTYDQQWAKVGLGDSGETYLIG
ncbi:cache domain-containing protein [Litorilituus lipolyticus]|uniref:cache domain-containing protein n=1 Tax=Litorilituus lipolyticus TaxID=2491017 RepID=UPI001BAD879B|nr:cache domain-containing protein [Litorilituus lipolyticus]